MTRNNLHSMPRRLLLSGAVFLMATTWSAFTLAQLTMFTPVLPLIVGGSVALAVGLFLNSGDGQELSWGELACVGIFAVGAVLWILPPDQMLLGGWDPGVYLHTGASLADSGSLRLDGSDFAGLSPSGLRSVSRNLHGIPEPFTGMRLLEEGSLSPQFFHGYPSLLAVAFGLAGLQGMLLVNPILYGLSLLVLFVLVRTSGGRAAAWLAVLWLALTPAQVWQAAFPTAELLTQVFLLFGAAALLRLKQTSKPTVLALFAGWAFGMAWITRYDTILLLMPLNLLYILLLTGRKLPRGSAWFLAPQILCGIQIAFHIAWVAPHYHPLPRLVWTGVGLCLAAGATGCIWARWNPWRGRSPWPSFATWGHGIIAVTFFLFWLGIWYIRPRLDMSGTVQSLFSPILTLGRGAVGQFLTDPNAWNGIRLESMYGVVLLLMGGSCVAGLLFRVRRDPARLILWSASAAWAVLLVQAFNDPFMMWITRRWIPVGIPLAAVAGGLGLAAVAEIAALRSGLPRSFFLGAAACLIGVTLFPRSQFLAQESNWPGLTEWVESVDRELPPEAVLLCDQPGFAAPFRFLHQRSAFAVNRKEGKWPSAVDEVRSRAQANHRPTYILTMNALPDALKTQTEEVRSFPLRSHVLAQPSVRLPHTTTGRSGTFQLYRWTVEP